MIWTPKKEFVREDGKKVNNLNGLTFCPDCGEYLPVELGNGNKWACKCPVKPPKKKKEVVSNGN